jgi:DNA-binding FrmR family transcriptional regulator
MTKGEASPAGQPAAPCGCSAREGRKAVAVDPETKARNLKRLRRIEGQVRGLQKMVDEERYCADILVQIASVQEALRGVGKVLLQNHLAHCVTDAIQSGDTARANETVEELVALWGR